MIPTAIPTSFSPDDPLLLLLVGSGAVGPSVPVLRWPSDNAVATWKSDNQPIQISK